VWLAEDPEDGSIAGMVAGEVVPEHPILAYPPSARIDNLWVAPAFRRAGLGRALVAAWRDGATKGGFTRHVVSTLARDARAVAFWRAVGFADLNVTLAAS
jgi:ribosomal protein S18 acetylase RimI-like enzyme